MVYFIAKALSNEIINKLDSNPEVGAVTYILNTLTSSANNAYKIKILGKSDEYLLVEYKKELVIMNLS